MRGRAPTAGARTACSGSPTTRGRLCFALALWNGADPILKERLFGLTGPEGNHGEDVKEVYYYLDATPTHSYLKALYRYPQRAFPYERAGRGERAPRPRRPRVRAGRHRHLRRRTATSTSSSNTPRPRPEDIVIRIAATNRGPEAAPLHLLPTLWFRNTWSWGRDPARGPSCAPAEPAGHGVACRGLAPAARRRTTWLAVGSAALLFTENDTNTRTALWGVPNATPYVKDGFHAAVVDGDGPTPSTRPATGTKAAAHYLLTVAAGRDRDGPAPAARKRSADDAVRRTPTAILATRLDRGGRVLRPAGSARPDRGRGRWSSGRRSPA